MLDAVPVRLYGKRGCPAAYSIRDFLQRSDVPFEWIELRKERFPMGGQAGTSPKIENYLGFPGGGRHRVSLCLAPEE